MSAFLAHPAIDEVIVALPADIAADPPDYLRRAAKPLRVVAGGERRQDSVATAFRQVAEHADVVIVHDAARPFVSADLIDRTIAAAAESGAALAAIQARDTVKLAGPARGGLDGPDGPPEGGRYVRQTLARESIFLAQTPQAFRRDVLREAPVARAAMRPTRRRWPNGPAIRCASSRARRRISRSRRPSDLVIAEAIAQRAGRQARNGTRWNRLRPASPRRRPPARARRRDDTRRIAARSDTPTPTWSAMRSRTRFSAPACLGDIGHHFPDSDPRWKDASSLDLLARAAALVATRGYEVGNVDVTVILERPKLRPYIDAMRAGHRRPPRRRPVVREHQGEDQRRRRRRRPRRGGCGPRGGVC